MTDQAAARGPSIHTRATRTYTPNTLRLNPRQAFRLLYFPLPGEPDTWKNGRRLFRNAPDPPSVAAPKRSGRGTGAGERDTRKVRRQRDGMAGGGRRARGKKKALSERTANIFGHASDRAPARSVHRRNLESNLMYGKERIRTYFCMHSSVFASSGTWSEAFFSQRTSLTPITVPRPHWLHAPRSAARRRR